MFLCANIALSQDKNSIDRVKEDCVDSIDWSRVQCNFTKDPAYTDSVSNILYPVVNTVGKGSGDIAQILHESLKNVGSIVYRDTPGGVKRAKIVSMLKEKIAQKSLKTCQKACLLKCASSNILKYESSISKYGSTKYAYSCEKGVCTEFSDVFDDLASMFNIPSRSSGSIKEGHAFNKIKIQGKWVYLEPQSNQCRFYTNNPESFSTEKFMHINNDFRGNEVKFKATPQDNTRYQILRVIEK